MSSHIFSSQPDLVLWCKKCLMPDTRPRIFFDQDGVCNACRHAETKLLTDWESRKKEFLLLLDKYRSSDGGWDCVVPWSGGKDSSSIAWKLKFEFGMNPLLVTFSPMLPNDVGWQNREQMIRAGFDHLMIRPNQQVHRRLARRFFIERGNPKVAWDAGVNAAPLQVAMNYGIKLVFYAEHGESEYGGRVLSEDSLKWRDFTEVIEHQIGDDPQNWTDEQIRMSDLNPYIYPDISRINNQGIRAFYFAWFFRWSMLENWYYIKDKIDFKRAVSGRTSGTFTDFDSLDDLMDPFYYYMQFIKFGFGRAVRDACRMIQNNQMTREDGLELVYKYDGEFPEEHLEEVLEYLEIDRNRFLEIVDKHRNEEIWKKENGAWVLRNRPH